MNKELRKIADEIVGASLKAVLPDEAVQRALADYKPGSGRTLLVATGKAAWQMAKAAVDTLGKVDGGVVVTKYDHVMGEIPGVTCYEAGHPVPDENSFNATAAALDLVKGLTADDTVLFLLSGGGSALFEQPLVSGEELQDITKQLLACGADIVEMNTIRKRLSGVKGGKFVFEGTQDTAAIRYVIWKSNNNPELLVAAQFALENGDITIKLDTAQNTVAELSGTPANEALTALAKQERELNTQVQGLFEVMNDTAVTDEAKADAEQKMNALQEQMTSIYKEFIAANITNIAGQSYLVNYAGMLGDDFLHKVVKDKAHGLQPDRTALGTGPAEDIVDQLHFRLGLALELEQHFAKFLPGHAGVVGPEHLHPPKLRDGGRMDIVGDDPEQEVLLLVALAQLALAPLYAKACKGNDRGDNQQEEDNQHKGLFLARRPGDFQVLDGDGVLAPGGLVLDIEEL